MKKAFTLIEVLIVVSILSLLAIALFSSIAGNREKAEDARVKSDLQKLKIAFEDYYGDNNCYPPPEWFDSVDDCGSGHLSPYLSSLPCDPNSGIPYILEYVGTQCGGFRLYATLQNEQDPDSLALRSSTGSALGNYGVSSTNTTVKILYQDPDSPVPPGHTYYYCSAFGNCTAFDGSTQTCVPYFLDDPNCGGGPIPCPKAGSCKSI